MINTTTKKIIACAALWLIITPHVLAVATSTSSFKVFLTVNHETPAPSPSSGGSGGGAVGTNFPAIINISVTPNVHGAVISYQTTIPATTVLSYGTTQGVSAGTAGDNTFTTDHQITISNLTANTLYYFSIEATSQIGSKISSGLDQFDTLQIQPVVNALSFTATAQQKDILLNWRLPSNESGETVKIVRSTTFYPSDITDGDTVFEGSGQNSFTDTNVQAGIRYYYTLFIKDASGMYSSGAVADAMIPLPGQAPETQTNLFSKLAKPPYVDPRIASLSLSDFIFSQPGRGDFSSTNNQALFIEGDKELTVKLSYDRVPEILKTIAVTLADPDDASKKFTFLLRANSDKTFYTATIAPLGRSGEYGMDIAVVDYKNEGLKEIAGSLLAVVSRPFQGEGVFVAPRAFTLGDWLMMIFVALALIGLSFVSARRIDLSYLKKTWSRYRSRR